MKHIDSALHTRGESLYTDDIPPPAGMLHAVVYGSPVAHGRLEKLDLSAARKADGVVAIFTAKDIPGQNVIGPIIQDEVLLVEHEVCYIGHPIALVIGESEAQARKAAALMQVEVQVLPVCVDPRKAFDCDLIIDAPRVFEQGDVDSYWDACDIVVNGTCEIGGQEHVPLETNRARAIPREDQQMLVYSSTQSPYATQKTVAGILGVPHNKVEVDVKRLGGGFGGKEDQASQWASMAAMAAQLLQRPVELVLNREEDIAMTGKRHPYSSDFKIGLKNDGTILCYESNHFQNSGAFADLSTAVLERTLFHATNAYNIPNARVMAVCCQTHLVPNTAFRGFGGPQGMFVIEAAIAKAADALGMDRDEVQAKNLLSDGDMFYYGQPVKDCRAKDTWNQLVGEFDLPMKKRSRDAFNELNTRYKRGVAVMPICFGISFTKVFLNQGSSLVHIYTDGSVNITTGGIEMGQGVSTNMISIASRLLGIDAARIKVESTNTSRIANMSPSAASATSDINGNATIDAIEQLLPGLKKTACDILGIDEPDAVTINDEVVHLGGHATEITWSQLVLQTYFRRIKLSAYGSYSTPGLNFDATVNKGVAFAYHVYGACLTSVTVDCLLGTYEIDRVNVVHDCGRPINEIIDRGQIEGGLAQGLGWMTLEDLQFDEKGRYTSGALSTYKLPDAYFMPDDLDVRLLNFRDNEAGPLGSKAVGEPPLMYGIGVYFALLDAMKAFRPSIEPDYQTPMTPERVLMGLHGKQV